MASAVLDLIVKLKDEASPGLGGIASSVGGMIAPLALVAAGTAAVTGALTSAVSSAATFEGSMGKLASVTGLSGEQMKEFSDLALKMGMETAYSAQEAADAMIELAKGGIDPATIKAGALKDALDLAAAGGLELAKSAEIVAKQLGVWASDGVTATNVVDLMAQAANASTVDVDELALGMANVGGVAKAAGAKFQDVVTTMALIAPGFASAADAGTSLKAVFNNLQPTTDKAKQAFYDLGLTTINTEKAVKALEAAGVKVNKEWTTKEIQTELENLADSFDMSAKDTTLWLDQFTDNRFYDATGNFVGMQKAADILADSLDNLTPAQRALALETIFGSDGMRAAALLAEKAGEGYDNVAASMSKAGSAAEQAAKMNQGLAKAWDALKGSVETIGIVVGMFLLPILTSLVEDAITPAVNAVLAWFQALQAGDNALTNFIGAVQDAGLFSTEAAEALSAAIPSIDGFGDVFTAVEEVIGIAMAAIETVVRAVLAAVMEFWRSNGADIMAFVTTAYETIKSIVVTVLEIIATVISTKLDQFRTWWIENFDAIQTILKVAWDAIKLIISTALTLIEGILKAFLAVLKGDTKSALDAVKDTFQTIWNNIVTILGPLWERIKDIVRSGLDAIVQFVNDKISAARDAMAAMVNAMRSAVEAGMGAVRNAIIAPIEAAIATVKGLIDGIWSRIESARTAAANIFVPNNPAPAPGSVNPVNGRPTGGGRNVAGSPRASGGVTINIDARGASPAEVEQAVDKALRKAGLRADARIKLA